MKMDKRFVWDYELSEADLEDDQVRRWYLARVLSRGGLADIRAIGVEVVREALPSLVLPRQIRNFWNTYFTLLDQADSPSKS